MDRTPLYAKLVSDAIQKVVSICVVDVEKFVQNKNWVNQSAIIMQLIHIIELVKKITHLHPELRTKREVHKMNGLRNIAAHDYMAVDMYIIWDVVHNYLPQLQKRIKELL